MMDEKLCKCGCGEAIISKRHHRWLGTPDYAQGHNVRAEHPMKGKKHSPETLKKLSDSHQGARPWRLGFKHSEETCKKMSESHKGVPLTEQCCKNLSKKSIRAWANKSKEDREQWGKNISTGAKGKHPAIPESIARMVKTKKAQFRDPEFVKKMAKAWSIKPNKPETLILQLLNDLYPGQWKYTGDFSFTINGKSPDFTNCNGQKKLIEFFGDYWHRGQNPQDRIDTFTPFGYETLVIWEHELKEMDSVINRIHGFMEAT